MSGLRAKSIASLVGALFVEGTTIGLSDEQLIARFALQGDEAAEFAFAALVERHGPMVLGVCRSALRDQHEAEDAFQATFLVFARKAGSLRVPDKLGPWLYGVARRTCQKFKARRSRLDRLERQMAGRAESTEISGPDQGIKHDEELRMLHEEISRLPDRYRTPLVLCHLEGLTQAEAAHRLGLPIGTVGVRLMRARERLRARLTDRGLAPTASALLIETPFPGRWELPRQLAVQTARQAAGFASRTAAKLCAAPSAGASVAVEVLRGMAIKTMMGVIVAVSLFAAVAVGGGFAFQFLGVNEHREPAPAPAAALPGPVADEAVSILSNGGFEDGDPEKPNPSFWQRGQQGPGATGVTYHWDRTVAHQGRASLHLKKTVQRYFPIAQWSQEVKRSGTAPRLKITGFVKAKKMTKAILDAAFVDGKGQWSHAWAVYIGAKNDGDPPATHDWKKYEGIAEIPEGTQKITVSVQIYGPGDVWVDDITAIYTDQPATDPLAVSR